MGRSLFSMATPLLRVASRALVSTHRARQYGGSSEAVATIVIHGGAWAIPDGEISDASLLGVQRAAEEGFAVLRSGGSALDAVESAVRILEDDPVFDAGTGSMLTDDGEIEMDAI